jgi:hypothetical protein
MSRNRPPDTFTKDKGGGAGSKDVIDRSSALPISPVEGGLERCEIRGKPAVKADHHLHTRGSNLRLALKGAFQCKVDRLLAQHRLASRRSVFNQIGVRISGGCDQYGADR